MEKNMDNDMETGKKTGIIDGRGFPLGNIVELY